MNHLDLLLTRGGPTHHGHTRTIVIESGGEKLICEYEKGYGIRNITVEPSEYEGERVQSVPFIDPEDFDIFSS
jgi:hypothetical protein